MDTKDLAEKGLKLRRELFGEAAVEQRMNAFGEFGEPLQHIINAYAYGDIWSRPGLSLGVKSLAMIAMMAAANRPAELRVHLNGALKFRGQARRQPFDVDPQEAAHNHGDSFIARDSPRHEVLHLFVGDLAHRRLVRQLQAWHVALQLGYGVNVATVSEQEAAALEVPTHIGDLAFDVASGDYGAAGRSGA